MIAGGIYYLCDHVTSLVPILRGVEPEWRVYSAGLYSELFLFGVCVCGLRFCVCV